MNSYRVNKLNTNPILASDPIDLTTKGDGCFAITNNDATRDFFVPAKTLVEWDAYKNKAASLNMVVKRTCCDTCPSTTTCDTTSYTCIPDYYTECTDSDPIGTYCGGGIKYATGYVVMLPGCENSVTDKPNCSDMRRDTTACDYSAGWNTNCDQTGLAWTDLISPGDDERPAAPNTDSDDGMILTNSLVEDGGPANPAAQYCYDLVSKGNYSNWYLPSITELNDIFSQYGVYGGLFDREDVFMGFYCTLNYWSSTQAEYNEANEDYPDAKAAKANPISTKSASKSNKVPCLVRCIRRYNSGGNAFQ